MRNSQESDRACRHVRRVPTQSGFIPDPLDEAFKVPLDSWKKPNLPLVLRQVGDRLEVNVQLFLRFVHSGHITVVERVRRDALSHGVTIKKRVVVDSARDDRVEYSKNRGRSCCHV